MYGWVGVAWDLGGFFGSVSFHLFQTIFIISLCSLREREFECEIVHGVDYLAIPHQSHKWTSSY